MKSFPFYPAHNTIAAFVFHWKLFVPIVLWQALIADGHVQSRSEDTYRLDNRVGITHQAFLLLNERGLQWTGIEVRNQCTCVPLYVYRTIQFRNNFPSPPFLQDRRATTAINVCTVQMRQDTLHYSFNQARGLKMWTTHKLWTKQQTKFMSVERYSILFYLKRDRCFVLCTWLWGRKTPAKQLGASETRLNSNKWATV